MNHFEGRCANCQCMTTRRNRRRGLLTDLWQGCRFSRKIVPSSCCHLTKVYKCYSLGFKMMGNKLALLPAHPQTRYLEILIQLGDSQGRSSLTGRHDHLTRWMKMTTKRHHYRYCQPSLSPYHSQSLSLSLSLAPPPPLTKSTLLLASLSLSPPLFPLLRTHNII